MNKLSCSIIDVSGIAMLRLGSVFAIQLDAEDLQNLAKTQRNFEAMRYLRGTLTQKVSPLEKRLLKRYLKSGSIDIRFLSLSAKNSVNALRNLR